MIISDGINHGKLQSIIVGELKKAGLKHRLKKIILKTVKDHKTVFGAPLLKVPSSAVICCGSTLSVPMVVSEMSSVLRANANIEGLFRKAGSQTRQKDIKRLLDAGGCVSDGHHPIDVASVLKLYLRCLPEPLISAEVQDLLLRCRLSGGEDGLQSILHTLLLLPVLHVHLLHYIMELLNFISSRHKDNLMDSSNLAIVMAPSIMPLPAAATTQRLEHHVALVKLFIDNAKHIGILTDDLMSQLDDDSDVYHAKRKKQRSGSLNRVLSGLRKMVTGSTHTPTAPRVLKTPVIKSASKRKFDSYEGLSAKTKKDIKQKLSQKELSFTPMKMGFERKRLRLSLVRPVSTPSITAELSKTPETSASSADLLTSTEHLFNHDTIDLSPDMRARTDYVRISKREYEEIKHRVERIEHRLSREFTDVTNTQQVQDAYEQTLEDVAMLHCPTSDNLARRLSRELQIRPSEQAKIIRSPSARKIGTIRRRSKENVKIVRHKSWNASSLSNHNDRFYPYGACRQRTDLVRKADDWEGSLSETSPNTSASSHKYQLRKRASDASDCNLNRSIGRPQARRSVNAWDASDNSNSTLDCSSKSNSSQPNYQNVKIPNRIKSPPAQKWRSAAAFFMDKTRETDSSGGASGRPSVNKLRRNAGAVLAKAKLFESGSDASSEHRLAHGGFARRPRVSQSRPAAPCVPARPARTIPPVPARTKQNLQPDRQKTPPTKKVVSPHRTPAVKKPLCTPRGLRAPAGCGEARRGSTPLRALHVSPRRRDARHKPARCQPHN